MKIKIALLLVLTVVIASARFSFGTERANAAGFGNYQNFSYNVATQTATWQFLYTNQDTFPTVQQFSFSPANTTVTTVVPATCTTALPTTGPVTCNVTAGGTMLFTLTTPIPVPCGTPSQVFTIGGVTVSQQSPFAFVLIVPGSTASNVGGVQVPNTVPAGVPCPTVTIPSPTPTATRTPSPTPVIVFSVPVYQPTPVIPTFQNPAAGALFNPIAKTPTPRPVVAAAPPMSDPGCNPPPGTGTAGICLRPPNTGDAGLKALEDDSAD